MDHDILDAREQAFYDTIREHVICYLLFLVLFISSYAIICRYKKTVDDYILLDDINDVMVYNLSVLICSVALATTIGQILLLPFSVISNEILLLYSDSYYMKWLNESLVQGLWNYTFLLSNLSLFILLPLAALLIQSVGFPRHRSDLKSRFMESIIQLFLLIAIIFGMAYILSNIFAFKNVTLNSIFDVWCLWNYYLPILYTCVSFFGCTLSLICTPLGFAHFFTVVGNMVIKPRFREDLEDEILMGRLEEMSLERKIRDLEQGTSVNSLLSARLGLEINDDFESRVKLRRNVQQFWEYKLLRVRRALNVLELTSNRWYWPRALLYLITMFLLLSLTVMEVLVVLTNTIELLIGYKALPKSSIKFTLGIRSLSILGVYGACLEVILILYILITSLVGAFTLPLIRTIRPRLRNTPFYHVVANCSLLLIFSSSLPILSKVLGITNFNLLGNFGEVEWLGNFKIILLYNIVFIVMALICLTCKATISFYEEVYGRLISIYESIISLKVKFSQMYLMIPPHHRSD